MARCRRRSVSTAGRRSRVKGRGRGFYQAIFCPFIKGMVGEESCRSSGIEEW
jgi:hypothetical protein